jgi:hypothetical protein
LIAVTIFATFFLGPEERRSDFLSIRYQGMRTSLITGENIAEIAKHDDNAVTSDHRGPLPAMAID